jgi:hypothetical protein
MTTRTEEATIPAPVLPVQPGPLDDRAPVPVDHVRRHGKRCYWDLTQCRWECHSD